MSRARKPAAIRVSSAHLRYAVSAIWDPDARVWIATSDDVPGLVSEAETLEALVEQVKPLVRELLALNHGIRGPDLAKP